MKKVKIAVFGSLIYDSMCWGPRLPKKGETICGYRNGFYTGGKGANQAVQAAKLGAEVYMIGKIGDDEPGKIIRKTIEGYGVNTDYLITGKGENSGCCVIMVDDNGDNAIMIAQNANITITKEEIDNALHVIDDCDVLMFQLETNFDAIEYVLDYAKDKKCKIIFNSAPALECPEKFFKASDYVTPNETECERYTGIMPDFEDREKTHEAMKAMMEKGAKNVVFTLGSHGSYFGNSEREEFVPAYKIKAVDATAAGDSFNAAFAFMIASGADEKTAMQFANAAGAVTAMGSGAQPSLGTLEKVKSFLEERNVHFDILD